MELADNTDFYLLEETLAEEERIIRDTARSFVRNEFLPGINEHFRNETFPTDLIPRLGELGFLGASLEGYGCAGLGETAYGILMEELEFGDSGLRSFCSVQSGLVMWPILNYGSEEQKERWLPRLRAGEAVGCFGLTEVDFGSDPGGMITRAEKTSAGYVLNGSKMWITNGSLADLAVVWAKLDGEIRGFLVDKGMKGFSANRIKNKFSLRASDTSELVFDNCEVPEANMLPGAKGLPGPLRCLNQARYGIAWGAVGAARACFEAALKYSKERIQFGKPIASFQLVQRKLALMLTEITKAQLLVLRLSKLKEAGKVKPEHISMAKMNNVAMALDIARVSRDVLGAAGITDEHPVGRHMTNLESVNTYEGTQDIHLLILGEVATGIPAYR